VQKSVQQSHPTAAAGTTGASGAGINAAGPTSALQPANQCKQQQEQQQQQQSLTAATALRKGALAAAVAVDVQLPGHEIGDRSRKRFKLSSQPEEICLHFHEMLWPGSSHELPFGSSTWLGSSSSSSSNNSSSAGAVPAAAEGPGPDRPDCRPAWRPLWTAVLQQHQQLPQHITQQQLDACGRGSVVDQRDQQRQRDGCQQQQQQQLAAQKTFTASQKQQRLSEAAEDVHGVVVQGGPDQWLFKRRDDDGAVMTCGFKHQDVSRLLRLAYEQQQSPHQQMMQQHQQQLSSAAPTAAAAAASKDSSRPHCCPSLLLLLLPGGTCVAWL